MPLALELEPAGAVGFAERGRASAALSHAQTNLTRADLVRFLALRIEAKTAVLTGYSESEIEEAHRWLRDRDARLWA